MYLQNFITIVFSKFYHDCIYIIFLRLYLQKIFTFALIKKNYVSDFQCSPRFIFKFFFTVGFLIFLRLLLQKYSRLDFSKIFTFGFTKNFQVGIYKIFSRCPIPVSNLSPVSFKNFLRFNFLLCFISLPVYYI